ncbi:hydrophobin [Coniophora puteana RWD-64-598 SS2]|uniref:Hydrophobin n=1 Tax=Coniophora puteana (strain RWD-64-598) TaxID=741705 RepID=A0A5M3MD80_CONPW|nr:hydrophobin [Coniophora puteana RWD-64-598 SS2]EIW76601.1 hydrophobin [Coniophora puteana RWD-64-598 SS2]
MFATLVILLPFVLASAALPQDWPDHNGQCTTGALSCCNNVQHVSDVSDQLGQLGLGDLLNGIDGQVGFQCTPIMGIGAGQGATCISEPVCCDNNSFNGLINLGCSPITVIA